MVSRIFFFTVKRCVDDDRVLSHVAMSCQGIMYRIWRYIEYFLRVSGLK